MEIVILLYKGFTALDVIGPYEVLCRLPDATVKFAAKEKGIVESEYASMKMVATHTLEEIREADILLIPGSTIGFVAVANDEKILSHVRRIDGTTKWTTSVCTGSIILAAAGLLKGRLATSHWGVLDWLEKYGANPVAERYIQQGKIITGAGVSAGMDMALYLVSIISGEDYAKMLQLVLEYYPDPPVDLPGLAAVPKAIEASAKAFLKSDIQKMSGTVEALLKPLLN
jgi:putative intracellular protease/amidase